jgi:hypothetical protein
MFYVERGGEEAHRRADSRTARKALVAQNGARFVYDRGRLDPSSLLRNSRISSHRSYAFKVH